MSGLMEYKDCLLEAGLRIGELTESWTEELNRMFPEAVKAEVARYFQIRKLEVKRALGCTTEEMSGEPPKLSEEAAGLLGFVGRYQEAVRSCYAGYLDCLWHVSPVPGLKEIRASKRRRDAYMNRLETAVFASSVYADILLFLARGAAGAVYVLGERVCIFPEDPFTGGDGRLKRRVFLYRLPAEGFVPTIDYRYTEQSSRYELAFSGEWVRRSPSVRCEGRPVGRLPADFWEYYEAWRCVDNSWEEALRICMENRTASLESLCRELQGMGKLKRITGRKE